jgi:thiosulfate/3-mercaptopyruvate sulfurtransferase
MPYETLISAKELALHITDSDWVIIDCRFDLADPGWGAEQYLKSHIPTAIYAHLNNELSGKVTKQSGRHPLPDDKTIQSNFCAWGISADTQVVVYDQSDGSIASRLWWLLRYFGHFRVAVLDGGYQKWLKEGLPLRSEFEHNAPALFQGNRHPEMVADIEMVKRFRLDPACLVIDARSPERHLGISEAIDPVAGHIPGSVNRYFGDNLNLDITYKTPLELRQEFDQLLGGRQPTQVVVYCGSGVTSCSNLLALKHAGIDGALLYPGSWSEWIRDPDNPIASERQNLTN